MFTPSSVRPSEPAIATYKVKSTSDLASHFQHCGQKQFSGRADLAALDSQEPTWSFFFHLGHLVWSVGELHPFRRWNRQLSQYCPHLAVNSPQDSTARPPNWDYESLVNLVRQGQIQQSNLSAIVAGNILELLFDVIQTIRQSLPYQEMQLTYRSSSAELSDSNWLVSIPADRAWQRAEHAWSLWEQSGLLTFSPNLAPVIWDDDALRQQTSLLAYHNLTTFANGHWTLRDLAVKLKQPLVPLTRSLMPYVNQGIMGLNSIGDLEFREKPSRQFSIAYIEDSRFDSAAMNHILEQAGYRFISIRDPIHAIPVLLEQKPDLIFLDLLMPITNGYEVCTQIRRITAFKEVPVVILTSSDGIVDRVRAKLAGASGFLAKPIETNKVLDALKQHLRVSVSSNYR
jgi:CheY-like chemotaxis protein